MSKDFKKLTDSLDNLSSDFSTAMESLMVEISFLTRAIENLENRIEDADG